MLFLKRILVLLGFVLIGILFWFYLKGNELIISWDTISELFQKEIYSTGFSFEGLNVPLDNLVYYLKSHFFPSIYKVNKLAYYLSLGTLLFGVSTVLGVLSYKRYLFGLALLALTFLSFRLENIFLSTSSFPFLIGFLAFGILYYAISNWFTQISLIQRISIFLGLFLIMIFIVKKWGKINEPVLELATFSSIISFISFIASCVWIGTQLSKILVGLINNNAKKGVSQLYPYLILNLILILNLFLVYLESSKLIEPNFFLISPLFYWILAVFSFWNEGLKKDDQVFFLELGLSFGALAFFILTYGTANDSHLDLSNDIIAVSFLSFSIGYFAYILLNFHGPIRQGLSIEKIMENPSM